MALRPELVAVVDGLLADRAKKTPIELDAIGEAIGTLAVSADEIDLMLRAIELRGFTIATREGGNGEAILKTVVTTARTLRSELGRPPKPAEIAERSGLSIVHVQHALSLVRIMQR